ncbi:MAG: MarR family winged helix-turn-helix transcriptional regulator [Gammaproteobacteria bacterium]
MTRNGFPPPSVSQPPLLVDGQDHAFRRLIYDLLTLTRYLETGRTRFADRIGVTPSQYSILMIVAEGQQENGMTASDVAATLHAHDSFVALQVGKLLRRKILERRQNPADRRSVLLRLTPLGMQLLEEVAPLVRLGNDLFFQSLDETRFRQLASIVAELIGNGPTALSALETAESLPPLRQRRIKRGRPRKIEPRAARKNRPESVIR